MRYIDYVLLLVISGSTLQVDATPVEVKDKWQLSSNPEEWRFQGQCLLSFTQASDIGALEMTLAFDINTHYLEEDDDDWSDEITSSCIAKRNTSCTSYARFNKWLIPADSTLNYGFELSYINNGTQNSPPEGKCTVGTGSAAITSTATSTIPSQATTADGNSDVTETGV